MTTIRRPIAAWALVCLALTSCGSDTTSPESGTDDSPPAVVFAVSGVQLDDGTNFGDVRDLEVTFTTTGDQTNVAAYRILLVAAGGSSLDLTSADAVPAGRFTTAAAGSGDISVMMSEGATDIDGNWSTSGASASTCCTSGTSTSSATTSRASRTMGSWSTSAANASCTSATCTTGRRTSPLRTA